MKKIFTLILLFISLVSFGQKKETNEAIKLFDEKKYPEAIVLFEKLLNNDFGTLTNDYRYQILTNVANLYDEQNNYAACYEKWRETIAFLKENNFNESAISGIEKYMDGIKSKIAQTDNSKSEVLIQEVGKINIVNNNLSSDNINENSKISLNSDSIKTDKIVTLNVSGIGKTIEEAKLNALLSAIEQVYGAFISSKTEILNDNLIKSEIVSETNGNIQKYNIVSQVELPNTGFSINITANVSIDKLTSFAESKGVSVEFKGGVFAANIKLQKLNEEAEGKVMIGLFGLLHEKFQTSFDYLIEAKDPVLNSDQINYDVPLKVSSICNQNFDLTMDYFIKVLSSISMNDSQVQDYNKINKKTYKIIITYNNSEYIFNLRNNDSLLLISRLQNSWAFYLGCFDVENGINTFHGPSGLRFPDQYNEWGKVFSPFLVLNYYNYTEKGIEQYTNGKQNIESISGEKSNFNLGVLHLNMPSVSSIPAIFEWKDFKSLNELDKIKNYTVKSSGIISKFKDGGYVIYEKNGNGIIAFPFAINQFNYWGNQIMKNPLGTGNKLFDGKLNTSRIAGISNDNIGVIIQKANFAGFNDWVIPSSLELSLIFNKIYLLGIGSRISPEYAILLSSTEQDTDFNDVEAFTLKGYYSSFMETYLSNKNISTKTELFLKPSSHAYKDIYRESKNTYIQPIRYFKY